MIERALKMLRVYHRMSQVNLANSINISNSYLSEIESGKKKPTLELLEKYSTYFKMPTSSILLFSEEIDGNYNNSNKARAYVADKVLKLLEWLNDGDKIKTNN